MLPEYLIAAGAVLGLWLLCRRLRGALLTPVRPGKHLCLRLEITADGAAPELEQTVDALLWLRANGALPAELALRDRGMDPKTAEVAAALVRSGAVNLVE